ncbi:reverse transcriptase domain-containing protein [Tanacetum coccineum]
MADNRTMAQLLEAPTVGYEDAIVVSEINADNFELKHGLLTLVQNKQFFDHDKEDPHAHIRYFNKITSTMRFPNVPSTSVKLMLFPFSLKGAARMWLEKEPPRSILTWDDLVSKFINKFFPPSKTTNLRNEITGFQQRFEETFYEAWDRFTDLLRACPHHVVAKVVSSTPGISPDVAALTNEVTELKNMMKNVLIDKQKLKLPHPSKRSSKVVQVYQAPPYQPPTNQPPVNQALPYQLPTNSVSKMDFESYARANDASMNNLQMKLDNFQKNQNDFQRSFNESQKKQDDFQTMMLSFMQSYHSKQASSSTSLPSNTVPNPRCEAKAIITRSGASYEGPSTPLPPPWVSPEREEETSMDPIYGDFTIEVLPPLPQKVTQKAQTSNSPSTSKLNQEGDVDCPKGNEPKLPYPGRRNVEKRREKDKVQLQKFWKMFKQIHFNISLADALVLMPKYTKMLKDLCSNKEKLEEHANTPLSENCCAVILKKLPEKLGDSGRFTIPCDFSKLKCQGLADLGASINLMPLSAYQRLGLTNLESTKMTLELANHQLCSPDGIFRDVLVPLILRDGDESLTLNMKNDKSKFDDKPRVESINMIDILNVPNYVGFKDLFVNKAIKMFSGSTTIQSNVSFPSSSPMKTSDPIFEEFTDEFSHSNSLPPGDDDSILKMKIHSNSLFEFDDNFKSNKNPLFEEKDKDVKIKSSPSSTLISPKESELIWEEFEASLEKDSIPPGIDLTLPTTLKVSSSDPTSPTLTREIACLSRMPMSFDVSAIESTIASP